MVFTGSSLHIPYVASPVIGIVHALTPHVLGQLNSISQAFFWQENGSS